jgi:hypothetical protein
MIEKNLKRLSKLELLEMLRSQELEIISLRDEIAKLEEKIKSKKLQVQEAGSIAEASLAVNNIFEAAQQAADQYLMNVKDRIDVEAEKYIRIKSTAEQQAAILMSTTEKNCSDREKREREYVDSLWNSLKEKLDAYYTLHPEVRAKLSDEDLAALSVERVGDDLSGEDDF